MMENQFKSMQIFVKTIKQTHDIALIYHDKVNELEPCFLMLRIAQLHYHVKISDSPETQFPQVLVRGTNHGSGEKGLRKLYNVLPFTQFMVKVKKDCPMQYMDDAILAAYMECREAPFMKFKT